MWISMSRVILWGTIILSSTSLFLNFLLAFINIPVVSMEKYFFVLNLRFVFETLLSYYFRERVFVIVRRSGIFQFRHD